MTTVRTSPRYECMGDSYPHIALPLNVGFAHSRNVSDVTSMFLPACILLANMVLSAAASRVTTSWWQQRVDLFVCYRLRQAASLHVGVPFTGEGMFWTVMFICLC